MSDSKSTNVLLIVLSILIPIVGWVLYFVKKDSEPEPAKIYGACGIAGFVIGLLIL